MDIEHCWLKTITAWRADTDRHLDGSNALQTARISNSSSSGDTALTELLLAYDATVKLCADTQIAAVTVAVQHGTLQCAEAVTTVGADANHTGTEGFYAIHVNCQTKCCSSAAAA